MSENENRESAAFPVAPFARPLLLIGGCPRSGTTPLMLMLNSDPRVFISNEVDLTRLASKLDPMLAIRERRRERTGDRMRGVSRRETATLDDFETSSFTRAALPAVLRDIYLSHHRARRTGATLVLAGDKFPRYYEAPDAMFALPFPVRYVHLTRNPLDVVNSMTRRTKETQQGRDWWRGPTMVGDMVDAWNRAFGAIRDIESHDDVLHLQYEDLVFETEPTLDRLRKFLDIDLQMDDPLVRDPMLHFDREFLDTATTETVMSTAEITAYRGHLAATGNGAAALRHLPDPD